MLRHASVAVFAVLALSGCGVDSTVSSEPLSVAGTYTLRTFNDRPLPGILGQSSTGRTELTAGTLILKDDKTFSGSLSFREVEGEDDFNNISNYTGVYVRNNDKIFLNISDGFQESGTVRGNDLTITYPTGSVLRYTR